MEGRFGRKVKAGAELSYTFDRGEFSQTAITGAAIAEVDNVYYRNARLKMYATYEIQPNMGVRVDLIHDRWNRDDWQWDGFTYVDGTTAYQSPNQIDTFVGVSAFYKFW